MPISQSVYFFGNSLVNYAEGGSETNAPIWMGRFAAFDGNRFSAEGGYGFLRNFADREEPNTDWGFEGVPEVYDEERMSFAEASFDNIVITPANFLQDQSPYANYYDEARSPLEATIDIVSDMMDSQPEARIYLYEGWADMGPFADDGNPSPDQLSAYHAFNTGAYHDWYVDLAAGAEDATGAQITIIPVASVLSELLRQQPLSEIPVEDLYVDSAPHGTETIYFLAGLTSYAAIFGTVPPADYAVPDSVHPAVAVNFVEVSDAIAGLLEGYGFDVATPLPGLGGEDSVQGRVEDESEQPLEEELAEQEALLPDPATAEFPEAETADIAEAPLAELARTAPATLSDEESDEESELPFEGAEVSDGDHGPCLARVVDVALDGTYRFELTSDDLAILHINGTPVLTNNGDDPTASQDVSVELVSGEHLVEVFYYEDDGGEILILDMAPEEPDDIDSDGFVLPSVEFEDLPDEEAEEFEFA